MQRCKVSLQMCVFGIDTAYILPQKVGIAVQLYFCLRPQKEEEKKRGMCFDHHRFNIHFSYISQMAFVGAEGRFIFFYIAGWTFPAANPRLFLSIDIFPHYQADIFCSGD